VGFPKCLKNGAGDGARTRDVQLGKTTSNWKQRTLRFHAPRSGDRDYPVFTLCVRAALNGAQTEHTFHLVQNPPDWHQHQLEDAIRVTQSP
jgi:hypothetical protein